MKRIRETRDQVTRRPTFHQPLLWLLWIAVFAALPVWISFELPGWDVAVYQRAIHAVSAGRDPYADAISVQVAAHLAGGVAKGMDPPFSYVYPPGTLPLLRLIGRLQERFAVTAYWLLYAAAALAQIWVCMGFVKPAERKWFLFLAPIAPFFPGLLANGVIQGGNIAYLLYASILLAAVLGWRGKGWYLFYAAVLIASCFKVPLLSLVLIAPLSARRQWIPAGITGALGAAAFAAQAFLWPQLFRHYLQAVDLLFRYNHDFGCGPDGLISDLLYRHNVPYSPAAFIIYLCYALPVLAVLIHLSRQYLEGQYSAQEWLPVLLVGVLLLNPRLIEYDVAPLALPLALIVWRSAAELRAYLQLRWLVAVFFLLNTMALSSWSTRKVLDGLLIITLFVAGTWRLWSLTQANLALESQSILSAPEEASVVCLI